MIVSTTLNGKIQYLKMGGAMKDQLDVLNNAEAWVPPSQSSQKDIEDYFLSQRVSLK